MKGNHMTDREHIYSCEECGAPIFHGDLAQFDTEGTAICEKHAATLSEIIGDWKDDLAQDEDSACWPAYYEDPSEVEAMIDRLQARLDAEGDVKHLRRV